MDASSTLQVKTGFFPLAFLFAFCTPVITINGEMHKRSWGTHVFSVKPGKQLVRVYVPYLFTPFCGDNFVEFNIEPGQSRMVTFDAPHIVFMKGAMKIM